MIVCPKRTAPKTGTSVQVTERDVEILRFLGIVGVAASHQVEHRFRMSSDMARRRLRVLRDAGAVLVHVLTMHDPNRYTLTAKGRELVCARTGLSTAGLRVITGLGRLRPHDEAVVDCYISLMLSAEHESTLTVKSFLFELHLRAIKPALLPLPDAFASVQMGDDSRKGVAFEIDRATEPVHLLTEKWKQYARLHRMGAGIGGISPFFVLCVVPSMARMSSLASAVWEADIPERLVHFALFEDVLNAHIQAVAFHTPRLVDSGMRARLVTEYPFSPSQQGSQHPSRQPS